MRKRKVLIAMLLASCMSMSSLTPAFAEELTSFPGEMVKSVEISADQAAGIPETTTGEAAVISETAAGEATQVPGSVIAGMPDVQENAQQENPAEDQKDASQTPAEDTEDTSWNQAQEFPVPSENPDTALKTEGTLEEGALTDGASEGSSEDPTDSESTKNPESTTDPEGETELTDSTDPNAPTEKPESSPFGETSRAVAAVSASEDEYIDLATIYVNDETGEILGVVIETYDNPENTDADPLWFVSWYAEDGSWTIEENGEEYYIEPGIVTLYGELDWNIQLIDGVSKGQGGYVLDEENLRWAYYLTAEDVQNTQILSEVWNSPEDAGLPAEMFIGAKGSLEKHAGLCTIDGEQYYLLPDGTVFADGKQNVDGVIYTFGADGKCIHSYILVEPGWVQRPDGYYWMQEDGTLLRTGGWQVLDGQRYFLKYKSGRRASGWESWNKGKYYLDPETGVVVTGLKEIDKQYYYFLPDGKTPGKMYTGWRTIDGKKYYFQSNGMRKKGWLTLNNKKYYFEKDGAQTFGWRSIGGKKYYFDLKNGFMRKGWLTIGKNKYYMEKDGSLHIGWRSVSGKKYYFIPKTGAMKKGWLTLNGKKYYFEADGSQRFGWRYLGGKAYYFASKTGVMQTGWLSLANGRYYLGADGARCTGMQNIGGKNYYFGSDGKLITYADAFRINGKYYSIDKNGVLTPFTYAESLAAQKLDQIGWNLSNAFKWSSGQTGQFYYYRNSDTVPSGYTAADYYAIYGFENGRGDCYVMACTFYQMAKLLGYDVHFVMGKVPLRRGGWGPHGWCEIDLNGTTYVCDPDFTWDAKRNGYMITYGTPGTWVYSDYRRVN